MIVTNVISVVILLITLSFAYDADKEPMSHKKITSYVLHDNYMDKDFEMTSIQDPIPSYRDYMDKLERCIGDAYHMCYPDDRRFLISCTRNRVLWCDNYFTIEKKQHRCSIKSRYNDTVENRVFLAIMLHFERRLRIYTYYASLSDDNRDNKARHVSTIMQKLRMDHNTCFNSMAQEIDNMIMKFGRRSYLTDLRSGSTDDRNNKLWNSLFQC